MLMRIFRPDRVYQAIKDFIELQMQSQYYIQTPPIIYDKVYKQSTEKTPIVFILSPGADPHENIRNLCEAINGEAKGASKFKYLSLGQGMEGAAEQMIKGGIMKGHWVLLENCHLLTKWLKRLEVLIEQLESKHQKPDPNF